MLADAAPHPPGVSTKDHAWRAPVARPDPRTSHRTGDSNDRSRLGDVEILSSDHEQVVFCRDAESGLKAIIAVHSTALGPALGGTRFYPYADEDAAVADALRLSRAMSYKNSLAGLDLGGGKAVIIGDPTTDKTEALLRAYGRFVEALGGRYLTACDVGTYNADLDVVARETRYAHGRSEAYGGCGDSSVLTAFGVFQGMRAAAQHTWGAPTLSGRTVAVAGVGKVGSWLVGHLVDDGADVLVTDVDPAAVARLQARYPQVKAAADTAELLATPHDVYAPCALGGALDEKTVAELPGSIVCGGPHALEDPVGGQHGRVAAAAVGLRPAVREARLAGHDVEVGVVGADVARGQVAPAERLDEPAVGAQQRLGLVGAGVADDDGLAAAEVEAGEAVLVRHARREGQDVGEGGRLVGVRVEPRAAERRSERRRMDGDDRPQPRLGVVAEDDLLVP